MDSNIERIFRLQHKTYRLRLQSKTNPPPHSEGYFYAPRIIIRDVNGEFNIFSTVNRSPSTHLLMCRCITMKSSEDFSLKNV